MLYIIHFRSIIYFILIKILNLLFLKAKLDAIKACSADGKYSDREKATVAKMAAKLGIVD